VAESLMGFTLGFVIVLGAISAWKVNGWAQDRMRNERMLQQELAIVSTTAIGAERRVVELASRPYGQGAADAAIAQLASRLSKLEKQAAEQDLTILDTAERVAHKLQDRSRKRRELELEQEPADEPFDPHQALLKARAFYAGAPRDEGQMQLDGIAP